MILDVDLLANVEAKIAEERERVEYAILQAAPKTFDAYCGMLGRLDAIRRVQEMIAEAKKERNEA